MRRFFKWLHDLIIGRSRDERWLTRVPCGWCVEFTINGATQKTIIDEDATLFDHFCTGYVGSDQWDANMVFDCENMPYRFAECHMYASSETVKVVLSNW